MAGVGIDNGVQIGRDVGISGFIPPPGAVARWDGGSFLDTSGSANVYDGTLSANPPTLTTGINGEANEAFDFASINSQDINFGNIINIKNKQKISISTWMKKSSGDFLSVSDMETSAANVNGIHFPSDENIYGLIRDSSVANSVNGDASVLLDTWVHICLVFDGTQPTAEGRVKLYVNDSLFGTHVGGQHAFTNNEVDDFKYGHVLGVYSNGQIGPTTLYARDLTPAEVAQLFAEKTV